MKAFSKKNSCFFFFALFLSLNIFSQTYNFKTFTEDDGLPQSYIYHVTQTNKGFLYLSTGDGFCVFNGIQFKTYTVKDGLAENFINTHFTDKSGITWIGHFQGGVSYFEKGKFQKIKGSEKTESKIVTFAEDKKRNIWLAAQQKGLFLVDTNKNFKTIESPFGGEYNVNAIAFDLDNQLVAGTDEGLFLFKQDDNHKLHTVCAVSGFEGKKIQCIVPSDSLGNSFWVGVPGEGIFKILKAGSCYYTYTSVMDELLSLSKNITAVYQDRSGTLWASLSGEGLCRISFNGQSVSRVTQIGKRNGLVNNYVQSILQDFEGNMWFGSSGGGLMEMPLNKFSYFAGQNNIKAILLDRYNNIWAGSDKALLQFQSTGENLIYNAQNGFVNDQVNALAQDSAGDMWIGTQENGVWIYHKEKNIFENFSKKNNLKSLNINTIVRTRQNNMVIGTTEGAYFCNPRTNKITLVTTNEGLLHNNVQHLYLDSKNRLWFSSHRAVPYYIKNDEFTILKNVPELSTFAINGVTEDKEGIIWIATEGDGLLSYDGNDFKIYKVNDGLLSNFCYFVAVDGNNDVWVGHKNGLSKKEEGKKAFRKFTRADGLLFQENNTNAVFKDKHDGLWFGTASGIVHYDNLTTHINNNPPKNNIVSISFNDSLMADTNDIYLLYKNYSVRIDYIGISLVDPAKVNYKYRLLGFDSSWRFTNSRFIEFPKLQEGNYTFQLMASNNDGVWNTVPAEISFEIGIPVWKQWWFYILMTIIGIAIIYFIISWRTQKLRHDRMQLEKMVNEKTHQLQEEKAVVEKIRLQLEEKNKDMLDSINYAKRIQEAILPSKELISKTFPEAFIYYKPKDIVSGDFYWFAETDNYYFIAAVDCTGHGVPGAFMSLIAATLLNEIVVDKQVSIPSHILYKLNSFIIEALKQDTNENSAKDGMDMSLCRIDKEKKSLVFAGAARPLYHVRNGELVDYKGQGYPIGGHYGLMNLSYESTEIEIQKGDMFYIFSDGYADQFREGDKKKFSSRRMKELLAQLFAENIEKQEELLDKAHNDWKGSSDQVDDVLVIGVRI